MAEKSPPTTREVSRSLRLLKRFSLREPSLTLSSRAQCQLKTLKDSMFVSRRDRTLELRSSKTTLNFCNGTTPSTRTEHGSRELSSGSPTGPKNHKSTSEKKRRLTMMPVMVIRLMIPQLILMQLVIKKPQTTFEMDKTHLLTTSKMGGGI